MIKFPCCSFLQASPSSLEKCTTLAGGHRLSRDLPVLVTAKAARRASPGLVITSLSSPVGGGDEQEGAELPNSPAEHLATNTPCLGRKGRLPSLFQSTGCSPSLRVSTAARTDRICTTKGCFITTSPEDFFPSLCPREQGHPILALHFIGEMRL